MEKDAAAVRINRSRGFLSALSHLTKQAETKPAEAKPTVAHPEDPKEPNSSAVDLRVALVSRQIGEMKEQLSTWRQEFEPRSLQLATTTEPRLLWIPGRHNQKTRDALFSRLTDFQTELEKRKALIDSRQRDLEEMQGGGGG